MDSATATQRRSYSSLELAQRAASVALDTVRTGPKDRHRVLKLVEAYHRIVPQEQPRKPVGEQNQDELFASTVGLVQWASLLLMGSEEEIVKRTRLLSNMARENGELNAHETELGLSGMPSLVLDGESLPVWSKGRDTHGRVMPANMNPEGGYVYWFYMQIESRSWSPLIHFLTKLDSDRRAMVNAEACRQALRGSHYTTRTHSETCTGIVCPFDYVREPSQAELNRWGGWPDPDFKGPFPELPWSLPFQLKLAKDLGVLPHAKAGVVCVAYNPPPSDRAERERFKLPRIVLEMALAEGISGWLCHNPLSTSMASMLGSVGSPDDIPGPGECVLFCVCMESRYQPL